MITKLHFLLTGHDKRFLAMLLLFSIFISLIETVGVSVIMPFISLASDFTLIEKNSYFHYVYQLFGFSSPVDFILLFGTALFMFYIFRSLLNTYYFYMLAKFTEGRYYLLSQRLFTHYLKLDYQTFSGLNSSHLTKTVINEVSYLTQLVSACLFMLSEIFVLIFLYGILLYVDWQMTLILSALLLVIVLFILKKISGLIKTEGQKRESLQKGLFEILSGSFGNFKLIKLFANETDIADRFSAISRAFVQTNIIFQTFSHIPRLTLDAIGFGTLSFIVTFLVWKNQTDIIALIPVLSLYVVALYRLLPSVHRIMAGYNKIMFYKKSLDTVYQDFQFPTEQYGDQAIAFSEKIVFEHVDFGYRRMQPVLKGVNLTVRKGEKLAVIGGSGSGKSTFVDLLIGLNRPTEGTIRIDEQPLDESRIVAWRKKTGYIPQHIYLFDGSVGENVAFGRDYDTQKLISALKQAKIWDFFETRQGLDTPVGEEGKLLSGGQKQRVAIARALYGNPEILVLDEATSALDRTVENEIMQAIYEVSRHKTLIIIAHRPETISGCERIIEIKEHRLSVKENGGIS